MLKGVNKHVVEVCDIESEYFEKAILFIRAEKPAADEQTLRAGARSYLKTVSYVPRRAVSRAQLALALGKLAAAAALGAGVAALFLR